MNSDHPGYFHQSDAHWYLLPKLSINTSCVMDRISELAKDFNPALSVRRLERHTSRPAFDRSVDHSQQLQRVSLPSSSVVISETFDINNKTHGVFFFRVWVWNDVGEISLKENLDSVKTSLW